MIEEIEIEDFLVNKNPFKEYKAEVNLFTEDKVWGDTLQYTMAVLQGLSFNKKVFEFGTFRGLTTYNMALTAEEVYTIDIGNNNITKELDEGYPEYKTGEVYKRFNSKNVTQLIGDSRYYDFTNLYNKFDLIWLDAGHSYEACIKDFETSLNLIKSDTTSMIIIDDYPIWSGVKQAAEEIAETKHLYYIPGGNLIIYINKPNESNSSNSIKK